MHFVLNASRIIRRNDAETIERPMPEEGPAGQASGHALRHPHHAPGTGCRPRRHGRPPLRLPEHARAGPLASAGQGLVLIGRLPPRRPSWSAFLRRSTAAPLDRRADRASRPCPRDPPLRLARDRLRDVRCSSAASRCWHGVRAQRHEGDPDARAPRRAGRLLGILFRPGRRRPRRRDPLARRRRRFGAPTPHPQPFSTS